MQKIAFRMNGEINGDRFVQGLPLTLDLNHSIHRFIHPGLPGVPLNETMWPGF
jgi:hypothetical protein